MHKVLRVAMNVQHERSYIKKTRENTSQYGGKKSIIEHETVIERYRGILASGKPATTARPHLMVPPAPSSPMMTIIHRFPPSIIIFNSRFRFLSHTG